MELHHEFAVPMGVAEAWAAFNDLHRIAPCFPGAAITSVDGDDFTGTARVKLGPISLQYTGTGTFTERDAEARRAVIEASGKDKRGNGTAAAVITASLHVDGDTSTRVVVDTDLKITGRPAQFGRGVIEDVGSQILGQFADCLASTLATSGDTAKPDATATSDDTATSDATAKPDATATSDATAASDATATSDATAPWEDPGTPARPAPPARRPSAAGPAELDLASVVGPALLQRLRRAAAGVVVTAVVAAAVTAVATAVVAWWAARRRR